MRYTKKKNYVWDAGIAYSVGLIASDGCLQRDGRHIDLTSKDKSQLRTFARALRKDLYIGKKFNGRNQVCYRVQFSDVSYYDFLLATGLTPDKSRTLSKLKIPDEFYINFLRGVFDGDGTTYGYIDLRWKSSFMYYTGFTSASIDFLEYIKIKNTELIGLTNGSIRKSTRASTLAYAKKDSYKLYLAMYNNCDNLYLKRKRTKLEGFIKTDGGDTIADIRASGEIGKHATLRG